MRITELRTNDRRDPMGIDLKGITFTWQVEEARGKRQAASRFVLSRGEDFSEILYDSGETRLPHHAYTPPLAEIIRPGERYCWRVTVTDETGDSAESGPASFEGGHSAGGWKGKWITPAYTREVVPVLRRRFTVTGEELAALRRARLYLCGLGLYEAYLNGEKIGDQFFTPYFTDYRYRVQYQTYDIAPLLREGENVLDVWLGDGWYKGRLGYLNEGQLREFYGDAYRLIADLYLVPREGAPRIIATDEDWESLKSPVTVTSIYDGEVYDMRRDAMLKAPGDRDVSGVRLTDGPAGALVPMDGLPVTRHETFVPQKIITTPRGETVLDFGQEITGWVEFAVRLPKDAKVTLDYGEILQDGCFYNDNLRSAKCQFTCISDGVKRIVRPHFTWYGFRYVRVTGMPVDIRNFHEFCAVALYSDLEEIGEIRTSLDKVNRLIRNTKWGQKGNFLDIPTDCPQRDERLGWTGDAQIFSGTAAYHMRTGTFFRKYLKDMAAEQRDLGGAVPYVVPDILSIGREKMGEPPYDPSDERWGEAGSAGWGDAATIIPWNLYLHTGNLAWLAEQYDNMKQWTDYIVRIDEECCGGKRLWTCGFHFGDWLSLDVEGGAEDENHREGGTDKFFIASAYYLRSAQLTAKAAALLERSEDAAYYERIAKEVRVAMRQKYRTAPGTLSIDTQTAYATALRFGLFDEEELTAAGERLHDLLVKWKMHLATGFIGTAYLCDALTERGFAEDAYTLLLNEDYPSWLYEVNMGATTTWERWNSVLPDGRISGTGMNSLNHYAYGCIAEWIYQAVCGLVLDEDRPGGQRVICMPRIDRRLGAAQARVRFAAGEYRSAWQIDGDRVRYELEVPFDGALAFTPDRPLLDITVNGERAGDGVFDRDFPAGHYVVEGRIA